jgi:hypothetical protein
MSDAMKSALTQHDFHEPGEIYDMHQPPDMIVHHDYHYYTTVVQEVYADYNPVFQAYDYSVQPDLVAPHHYDYTPAAPFASPVVHPSSVVGGYYDYDYHLAHHDVLAPPVALVGAAAVHGYYDYDYRLAHHGVLPLPPPPVASVHHDYRHPLNQVHHDYTTDIVHYASYDYHFDPVVGSMPPVVNPGAVSAVVYAYGDYQLYADYPPAAVDTVVYQDYDYSLGPVDYNDAVLRPDGSNAIVVPNPGPQGWGAAYLQDYHDHHFAVELAYAGDKESDYDVHDYHTAFVGTSDILANRFLHRKHGSKTEGVDYLMEHPWESLKKNKTEEKDNAPSEVPDGIEVLADPAGVLSQ